jgi:hypothetical protein
MLIKVWNLEGISEQKVGEKNTSAGQCTATLQGH